MLSAMDFIIITMFGFQTKITKFGNFSVLYKYK